MNASIQKINFSIADSDYYFKEILVRSLLNNPFNHIVKNCNNGHELISQLYLRQESVFLIDLYMPIMDGWQFHRAQLRTPQLANIPVIVMSAVAHALQPLAWFQAVGYLPKPFALDAVLALAVPLCAPSRPRS